MKLIWVNEENNQLKKPLLRKSAVEEKLTMLGFLSFLTSRSMSGTEIETQLEDKLISNCSRENRFDGG